jgi:hypothetical protein
MEKDTRYNIISIICGTWFLFFGMIWTYWISLIIAYPVGLLGLYFWKKANAIQGNILNRVALSILITGLIASIGILFFYR